MTLREFMHTPNPHLDNLAMEAETQRTIDEEAAYDARCTETKKEIKTNDKVQRIPEVTRH